MPKKRNTIASSRSKPVKASFMAGLPLWVWAVIIGAAFVLLAGGLLYLGYRGPALASEIDGVQVYPDPGRGHEDGDLTYPQPVPVGGIHNPEWENCGIYDKPVRTENAVHSMEHGAVWITYSPDLPADQVETLRSLVRQEQSRLGERLVLLSPKDGLDAPIIATAWRVQLKLDSASDERLPRFLQTYQRGPFYPEPGASCTFGGIGEPLS